jgi:hypothetical protein
VGAVTGWGRRPSPSTRQLREEQGRDRLVALAVGLEPPDEVGHGHAPHPGQGDRSPVLGGDAAVDPGGVDPFTPAGQAVGGPGERRRGREPGQGVLVGHHDLDRGLVLQLRWLVEDHPRVVQGRLERLEQVPPQLQDLRGAGPGGLKGPGDEPAQLVGRDVGPPAQEQQVPHQVVVTVGGGVVELVHHRRAVVPDAGVGDHLSEEVDAVHHLDVGVGLEQLEVGHGGEGRLGHPVELVLRLGPMAHPGQAGPALVVEGDDVEPDAADAGKSRRQGHVGVQPVLVEVGQRHARLGPQRDDEGQGDLGRSGWGHRPPPAWFRGPA